MLRFVGDGDQKNFNKNPRHFSMQNPQANTKKIFTKFFWRVGKVIKSETPKCGGGRLWDLEAQGGSAKAPARNNAPGRSTARATRTWRKHALLNSETLYSGSIATPKPYLGVIPLLGSHNKTLKKPKQKHNRGHDSRPRP